MKKLLLLIGYVMTSYVSLALKPAAKYEAIPDTLKMPYEKNVITTSDHFKLQSWTFLPEKSVDNRTTLVLAYADAGDMSWWLTQATIFAQTGYTVVLFDYRGFGASDPFPIDAKMLYYNEFATDLTAVVQFAKTQYPKNKTGVWAFSMGTIITTLAAPKANPDFIIGDSYVTDPVAIRTFYLKKKDTILLPPGAKEYAGATKKVKVPMLLFTGIKDEVTTNAATKKMKTLMPNVRLVTYNGGHMEGFSVLSKDFPGSVYIGDIDRFLKMH